MVTWDDEPMRLPEHLAWTWVDTPVGELLIITSPLGVRRTFCAWSRDGAGGHGAAPVELHQAVDAATQEYGQSPVREDHALYPLRQQVEEWFDGTRQNFDVALDLTGIQGFRRRVYQAIQHIPYGQTASYGQIAAAAGSALAARAVGIACRDIPLPVFLPVHRVTRADGSTGEPSGVPGQRQLMLQHERWVLGDGDSPWM